MGRQARQWLMLWTAMITFHFSLCDRRAYSPYGRLGTFKIGLWTLQELRHENYPAVRWAQNHACIPFSLRFLYTSKQRSGKSELPIELFFATCKTTRSKPYISFFALVDKDGNVMSPHHEKGVLHQQHGRTAQSQVYCRWGIRHESQSNPQVGRSYGSSGLRTSFILETQKGPALSNGESIAFLLTRGQLTGTWRIRSRSDLVRHGDGNKPHLNQLPYLRVVPGMGNDHSGERVFMYTGVSDDGIRVNLHLLGDGELKVAVTQRRDTPTYEDLTSIRLIPVPSNSKTSEEFMEVFPGYLHVFRKPSKESPQPIVTSHVILT